MFYFVKVKIDFNKLPRLAQKLESGELDTSSIMSTYCLKDEPTIGLNIWEAEDRSDFERKFEPHKEFYADVIEVSQVILPEEAKEILIKQIAANRS